MLDSPAVEDFDDIDLDLLIETASRRAVAANPSQKEPIWSEDEIRFLHENAGKLDDQEIAEAIGRNQNGVKIFRVRQGLKAVSQAGVMWITANAASELLNIDNHKLVYWCRSGLLPARKKIHAPSGREYFLVKRETFKRWCVNPEHWVYFDWRLLTDEHIRRLCELRQARWNDEWWTTSQVAKYLGIEVQNVKRYIQLGRIHGYRPKYSLGGRHFGDTWRWWFVRKSEATKPIVIIRRGDDQAHFTLRADEWILKARDELGLSFVAIGRSMASKRHGKRGPTGTTISNRYQKLCGMIGLADDWVQSLKYGG